MSTDLRIGPGASEPPGLHLLNDVGAVNGEPSALTDGLSVEGWSWAHLLLACDNEATDVATFAVWVLPRIAGATKWVRLSNVGVGGTVTCTQGGDTETVLVDVYVAGMSRLYVEVESVTDANTDASCWVTLTQDS